MKKLSLYIFLGLMWCNTSLAFNFNGLEGIKEFELTVEADEICGVTKSKIENSVRYLISNSKIRNFQPNEIIVNQNDDGDSLFIEEDSGKPQLHPGFDIKTDNLNSFFDISMNCFWS